MNRVHIVLVEPEIPQNTGNIARTCALTRSVLHLVKPLGFSLEDRYLKRAGLDYWDKVEVNVWDSLDHLWQAFPQQRKWLATTRTERGYQEITYELDDMLIFGAESRGLPASVINAHPDRLIRIPMLDIGRSLNLSNSVAIILYEALRQHSFPGLR